MAVYLIEDNSHDRIKPELQRIVRQYSKVRHKSGYKSIANKLIKQWQDLGMEGEPNLKAIDMIGSTGTEYKRRKGQIDEINALIPECQEMMDKVGNTNEKEYRFPVGLGSDSTYKVKPSELVFNCYENDRYSDTTYNVSVIISKNGKVKFNVNRNSDISDTNNATVDFLRNFERFKNYFYRWFAEHKDCFNVDKWN